jgi:hypothetical protein
MSLAYADGQRSDSNGQGQVAQVARLLVPLGRRREPTNQRRQNIQFKTGNGHHPQGKDLLHRRGHGISSDASMSPRKRRLHLRNFRITRGKSQTHMNDLKPLLPANPTALAALGEDGLRTGDKIKNPYLAIQRQQRCLFRIKIHEACCEFTRSRFLTKS